MAISREELKKLVIKEMLEQDLKNEGVGDWLRSKASSMLTTTGKKMTQAGEKVAPPPQLDDKTLRKVGEFLQMAQRSPEITKAILATQFGKQVFGSDEEENLEEALSTDFIKMIKNKKVTPQMLTDFIESMKKNEKANQMMIGLGLIPKGTKPAGKSDVQQTQTGDTEVSDSDIKSEEPASTPEQGAAAAQPTAVPGVVSGTEVTTKNAKIKFLPPEEDVADPAAAQKIALDNADQMKKLKDKFDRGEPLSEPEKNQLLSLLGVKPQTKAKKSRKPAAKSPTIKAPPPPKKGQKTRKESLQQIITEEIFNVLTGKTK